MARIVDRLATITEFRKPEATGESELKTFSKCSKVGVKLITLAGTA